MNRQRKVYVISQPTLIIIGVLSLLALFSFFTFPSPFRASNPTNFPSVTNPKLGIVHIVMFEFNEGVKESEITDVCNRMLALKEQCLHPTTQKQYVKSGIGGKQNSPEGLDGGMTHIFVEEFENEEDRKYYLEKDPAHLAFVRHIGNVVKKAQVVDFTPGIF